MLVRVHRWCAHQARPPPRATKERGHDRSRSERLRTRFQFPPGTLRRREPSLTQSRPPIVVHGRRGSAVEVEVLQISRGSLS